MEKFHQIWSQYMERKTKCLNFDLNKSVRAKSPQMTQLIVHSGSVIIWQFFEKPSPF